MIAYQPWPFPRDLVPAILGDVDVPVTPSGSRQVLSPSAAILSSPQEIGTEGHFPL